VTSWWADEHDSPGCEREPSLRSMMTHHAGTCSLSSPLVLIPWGLLERRYMGGGTLGDSSRTIGFVEGDLSSDERAYEGGERRPCMSGVRERAFPDDELDARSRENNAGEIDLARGRGWCRSDMLSSRLGNLYESSGVRPTGVESGEGRSL
jgi:hypothetical protein